MKRFPALLMAILVIGALAIPAGAAPEPAQRYDLDDETNTTASFTSEPQVGTNVAFLLDGTATDYSCEGTPEAQCERVFLAVRGLTDAEIAANPNATDTVNVTAIIDNYSVPVADFDLRVYHSDVDGNIYDQAGDQSGNNPGDAESVWASTKTTAANPVKYLMVEVVVFASPGSTYDMDIRVS